PIQLPRPSNSACESFCTPLVHTCAPGSGLFTSDARDTSQPSGTSYEIPSWVSVMRPSTGWGNSPVLCGGGAVDGAGSGVLVSGGASVVLCGGVGMAVRSAVLLTKTTAAITSTATTTTAAAPPMIHGTGLVRFRGSP